MGSVTPMRGTSDRVSESGPQAADEASVEEALASRALGLARRRVRALEKEVAALQDVRRAQAAHIEAINRSTSWRITRPMRGLVMLLRGQLSVGEIARRLGLAGAPPEARRRAPELPRSRHPETGAAEPAPLSFPLPGRLAHPPELAGGPVEPLAATVSVIIPTFNAGSEFHWLLRKLKAQQGLADVEIVVVDSGSADGTPELAEAAGCIVVRIPNSEFSHSHARNLGADKARGELLLFTVQDAYPVGDHWLYSLARALTRPASEAERISALSCSEYPRRDSELFYNAAIDTHYQFLGCKGCDRIGGLSGDDHVSLRGQGQLSDVACMIPAQVFQAYRYEGRYAEDLILGVRMIRDGHRLALLSSVQVIHSHNRPAPYHLKRTFVDVLFLIDAFPDFSVPFVDTVSGAMAVGAALKVMVDGWRPPLGDDAAESLWSLSGRIRRLPLRDLSVPAGLDFDLPELGPWIAATTAAEGWINRADAEMLRTMLADKLESLAEYVARIYGEVDASLAEELAAAARKTLASTVGAQLCFLYLNHAETASAGERAQMQTLRDLMLAGI